MNEIHPIFKHALYAYTHNFPDGFAGLPEDDRTEAEIEEELLKEEESKMRPIKSTFFYADAELTVEAEVRYYTESETLDFWEALNVYAGGVDITELLTEDLQDQLILKACKIFF